MFVSPVVGAASLCRNVAQPSLEARDAAPARAGLCLVTSRAAHARRCACNEKV